MKFQITRFTGRSWSSLLALTLMLSALACKSEKQAAEVAQPKLPEFLVGVIAPLSGPWSDFGESIRQGATVGIAELNKRGGILGKQVGLVVEDSGGDPDRAFEIAHALITEQKVKLLLGTVLDAETISVAQAAAELKTPFLYVADGPLKTCSQGQVDLVAPYVWSMGLTPEMAIEPLLIHLAEKLRQVGSTFRFIYFGTQTPSSTMITDEVRTTAAALGFENSETIAPDPRISDFYEQIQGLFRFGADVLFVTVSQSRIGAFVEQAHKMSVRKDLTMVGLSVFSEENVRRGAALMDGAVTATRYVTDLDSPANRDFLARWKETYPTAEASPTALGAAGAYSGILLAGRAFAKAGSDNPEAFRTAMNGLELELPQGRVIVDAKNHSLILPLYAAEAKAGALVKKQFLGDVSHAGLAKCHPQLAEPPEEKRPRSLPKRADSIAETNRTGEND